MEDLIANDIIDVSWTPSKSYIKVIGVGGGGCNAVNYMLSQNIKDCDLIVCNTDSQALNKSDVPMKIQLGEGLGAGTNPTKGRNAALESIKAIENAILNSNTKMLFITAGMGGGTGTGASPIIAKMAKDNNILTVAVVTLPFKTEGDDFLNKAIDGIHELAKNVDSLLIINNEKLYEYFGDCLIQNAYPKADEILATAVRGIIEIITSPGYVNVDFEDVKTMMKNSGLALMGCGTGSGANRLEDAVKGALESPLLNDFDLKTAKNLLINITVGRNNKGLEMKELEALTQKITEYTDKVNNFKRGIIFNDDEDFGDRINITAIATGFKLDLISLAGKDVGKRIYIDSNFIYDKNKKVIGNNMDDKNTALFIQDNDITIKKIGFNTSENNPKFNFTENNIPHLCYEESGIDKAELIETAAIRRIQKN